MAKFVLLLHDNPQDFGDASPAEIESMIGEYMAWREKVAGQGRLVGGEKLTDEGGRHLSQRNGAMRVVDGPFTEAKEVLGGYFLVTGEDYDDVVELCRDHPHLKYGARIEVRQIHEFA